VKYFALGQSAVYFFRSSGSSLFYHVFRSIFYRKKLKSVVFIDQAEKKCRILTNCGQKRRNLPLKFLLASTFLMALKIPDGFT